MKTKGAGLYNSLNLRHIEQMASRGMTRAQIGDYFGVTGQRIGQLIKEHPEMDEAFNRGLAKGIDKATGKLMELIEEKNIVAILFFLKCCAKWKEAQYEKEVLISESPKPVIFIPHNNREPIDSETVLDESICGAVENHPD